MNGARVEPRCGPKSVPNLFGKVCAMARVIGGGSGICSWGSRQVSFVLYPFVAPGSNTDRFPNNATQRNVPYRMSETGLKAVDGPTPPPGDKPEVVSGPMVDSASDEYQEHSLGCIASSRVGGGNQESLMFRMGNAKPALPATGRGSMHNGNPICSVVCWAPSRSAGTLVGTLEVPTGPVMGEERSHASQKQKKSGPEIESRPVPQEPDQVVGRNIPARIPGSDQYSRSIGSPSTLKIRTPRPSAALVFSMVQAGYQWERVTLQERKLFSGSLLSVSNSNVHRPLSSCCSVWHTCPILETHVSDNPPGSSSNPTPPSRASKGGAHLPTNRRPSQPHIYSLPIKTLESAPIIQEHSLRPAIARFSDKSTTPYPYILQLSQPPNPVERMSNLRYHRSRSSAYTTRINSGIDNQASFSNIPRSGFPRLHGSFQPSSHLSPFFDT